MKTKKRVCRAVMALALAAGFALSPLHINQTDAHAAPAVFFEVRESQQISRNTHLHRISRVTEAGLLDISVLEIPLDDPLLAVSAFNSDVELGLRQTTTTMLADAGAIAGVNGDFFGLAGTHSVPLGFEFIDGHMSAQNNAVSPSFLIGNDGAFIQYVRPRVELRLNGENTFPVGLVNMVTDLAWPSFLTYGYITSTAEIDARLGRSYKLVVHNDIVTAITHYTVHVPENGFVVIMNPIAFHYNQHHFHIGQRAEMLLSANVNLGNLHAAISGNTLILENGAVPYNLASHGTGRAPRTLLGISQDGNRLILMTIDGRSHSIGANLMEAAHYMRQFGAFWAINLDGGGSTTMAARLPGEAALSVINTPSDGRERNVINTIGLLNNSYMGPITSIEISAGQQNIPVGMPTPLSVIGFDAYFNHMAMQFGYLTTSIYNAVMTDYGIVPQRPGPVIIHGSNGFVHTQATFNAIEIVEIIPSSRSIFGATNLTFQGIDNLGSSVLLDASRLAFEVFPPSLGTIQNGRFTPGPYGQGNGWARVFTGMANTYIPVSLHRQSRPLITPATAPVGFSSWPQEVGGRVVVIDNALHLYYEFDATERTQAAYIDFLEPQTLYTVMFGLEVYGNYSGHWLRGNILDADGNNFPIDFVRHIDFSGNRYLAATVPAQAVQPVALTRVYVVSLSEEIANNYQLTFRNIRVYEIYQGEPLTIPQGTRARDPLYTQFFGEREVQQADVTFMGPMTFSGAYAPSDWYEARNHAIAALARDSSGTFYGGINDLSYWLDVPAVYFTGRYTPLLINDVLVIQMMASAGGFLATGAAQWSRIVNDLSVLQTANIIIHTNLSPLNFHQAQEFELFHQLLLQHTDANRNIFVVSNGGAEFHFEIRDGVRYINLPALYVGTELNPEFAILRFRSGSDGLQYTIERIFR